MSEGLNIRQTIRRGRFDGRNNNTFENKQTDGPAGVFCPTATPKIGLCPHIGSVSCGHLEPDRPI